MDPIQSYLRTLRQQASATFSKPRAPTRQRKPDEQIIQEGREEAQKEVEAQQKAQAKADKAAADEAKRAENNTKEEAWRAEGRPMYVDAHGIIQPVQPDAVWQQQKQDKVDKLNAAAAEKQQKEAVAAQKAADAKHRQQMNAGTAASRAAIGSVDDQIKTSTSEAELTVLEKRKNKQKVDAQIKEIEARLENGWDLTPQQRTSAEQGLSALKELTPEQNLEVLKQQAGALQTDLDGAETTVIDRKKQELAWERERQRMNREVQTFEAGIPLMRSPNAEVKTSQEAGVGARPEVIVPGTPEARTKARERRYVTSVRDIEQSAGLSPEQKRAALATVEKRFREPKLYEQELVANVQKLSDEELSQIVDSLDYEVPNTLAGIETKGAIVDDLEAQFKARVQRLRQAREQVVQSGVSMADSMTLTLPDGTAELWPAKLAESYVATQRQHALDLQQAGYDDLDLDIEEHNLEAAKAEVAKAELVRRQEAQALAAEAEKQMAYRQMSATGQSGTVQALTDLEKEMKQRKAAIEKQHAAGSPQRQAAMQALQKEAHGKATATQEKARQQAQSGAALYDQFKQLAVTDWQAEKDVAGRLLQAAQAKGMNEADARYWMNYYQRGDWQHSAKPRTHGSEHFLNEVHRGVAAILEDTPLEEAEQARVLPDGLLTINPALHGDEKRYAAAVKEAPASKEAKAEALKAFPALNEAWANQVLDVLQTEAPIPGLPSFEKWRESRLSRDPEYAAKTGLARQTLDYMKLMKGRNGVSTYVDALMRRLVQGSGATVGGVLGAGGLVTGALPQGMDQGLSEFLSTAGVAWNKTGQMFGAAQSLKGGTASLGLRAAGQAVELLPQIATMIAGAGIAGGSMKAVAALSAAQTAGAQYVNTYETLRKPIAEGGKGMTHEQAWAQSAPYAVASGLVTAVLTTAGGPRGIESLAVRPSAMKAGMNAAWKQAYPKLAKALGIGSGAVSEIAEELPDEIFSQISEALATNPGADVSKIVGDFIASSPELMIAIGAMGAGGEILGGGNGQESSSQEVKTAAATTASQNQASQPAASTVPAKPETVAAAEATVAAYADPKKSADAVAVTKARAGALLKISQGAKLEDLSEAELNGVGFARDMQTGEMKPGRYTNDPKTGALVWKAGETPPNHRHVYAVPDAKGKPQLVIPQASIDRLKEVMPEVAAAIKLDERARVAQIKAPATEAKISPKMDVAGASPERGASPQVGAAAAMGAAGVTESGPPSAVGTPVGGDSAAPPAGVTPLQEEGTLTVVEEERAEQLAFELSRRGLSDQQAGQAARLVVQRLGVNPDGYAVQMAGTDFDDAMSAMGWVRGKEKKWALVVPERWEAATRNDEGRMTNDEKHENSPPAEPEFDEEAAAAFMDQHVRENGDTSNEELVKRMQSAGYAESPAKKMVQALRDQQGADYQRAKAGVDGGQTPRAIYDAMLADGVSPERAEGAIKRVLATQVQLTKGKRLTVPSAELAEHSAWVEAKRKALLAVPVEARKKVKAVLDALERKLAGNYGAAFDEIQVVTESAASDYGGGLGVQGLNPDANGNATFFRLVIDPMLLAKYGVDTVKGAEVVAAEELIHAITMGLVPRAKAIAMMRGAPEELVRTWWQTYYAADIQAGTRPPEPPAGLMQDDEWAFESYHEISRALLQDRVLRQKFFGLALPTSGMTTEQLQEAASVQKWLLDLIKQMVQALKSAVKKMNGADRTTFEQMLGDAEMMYHAALQTGQKISELVDYTRQAQAALERHVAEREMQGTVDGRLGRAPLAVVDDGSEDLADAADAYLDAPPAKEPKPKKATGGNAAQSALVKRLNEIPDPDTGKENIIVAIVRNGRITRPSKAYLARQREQGGNTSFAEWDWMERSPVPFPFSNLVFRAGNGSTLNRSIQDLHDRGFFPGTEAGDVTGDMVAEKILDVIDRYNAKKSGNDQDSQEQRYWDGLEEQALRFERATESGPVDVHAASLQVGDVMLLKGDDGKPHRVEVIKLDLNPATEAELNEHRANVWRDASGRPVKLASVTLKDGTTFGVQTISGDERIYVDALTVSTEDKETGIAADAVQGDEETVGSRWLGSRAMRSGPVVTAEQDAEYLSAVEAGDMAKAQAMVDATAKAAGYEIKGWHGSPDARFLKTDPVFRQKFRKTNVQWFAKDRRVAVTYADDRRAFDYQNAEPATVQMFLRFSNPMIVQAKGQHWRDAQQRGKTSDVIEEAQSKGHDGVIIMDVQDDYQSGGNRKTLPTTTYATFSAEQIKSADPVTRDKSGKVIPLSQRFNPESDSILNARSMRGQGSLFGSDDLGMFGAGPLFPGTTQGGKAEMFQAPPANVPSPDFNLESTSPEQLRAEATRREQAEKIKERQSAPLVGTQGDIGQMDMLGGGDLFASPAPRVDTPRQDAPVTAGTLESDRPRGTAADGGREAGVSADAGLFGADAGRVGADGEGGQDTEGNDRAADGGAAPAGRAGGAERVQGEASRVPGSPAGSAEPAGSSGIDDTRAAVESGAEFDLFGTAPERPAADEVAEERASTPSQRLIEQATVQNTAAGWDDIVPGDLENIAKTLPILLPQQHDDVRKAEQRWFNEQPTKDDPKKGMLFTNGTGTGKTFTGLGIIKRFEMMGRGRVLIVVPSQPKVTDWQNEGLRVMVKATALNNTTDVGKGVVVTTYANFRANSALQAEPWDLIVYDESHYLGGNAQGTQTENMGAHYRATNKPGFYAQEKAERAVIGAPPDWADKDAAKAYEVKKLEKAREIDEKLKSFPDTKAVFLSATPFSYHKSLGYADGYLFNSPRSESTGYNVPQGMDRYLVENFGWSMRTNRLTSPPPEVDVGLMEREWSERQFQNGAMSGRMIDVPYDYSREFILLDSQLGKQLDEGFHDLAWGPSGESREEGTRWEPLRRAFRNYWYGSAGGYSKRMQLMESIKVAAALERMNQHLDLGRKIVLFHSYNNADPVHPFTLGYLGAMMDAKDLALAAEWRQRHPELVGMDFKRLWNPRELVAAEFGERARFFNGEVASKERTAAVKAFNADDGGVEVIMIQMDAGKEGISLHDVTGTGRQRVLMNAALPVKPTDAIQSEGRIYRIGVLSNAIQEYLTLHTTMERSAFGSKISERTGTVENMALGKMARTLKDSFKSGYLNAHSEEPSAEQGLGGKKQDAAELLGSDMDRAKSYYFSRQKKTSRNKAAEGVDYFATPEPVGLTMVRFLDAKAGMDLLEPSAGHGAIGRFFPEFTTNKYVEPSRTLSDELRIKVAAGKVEVMPFEDLHIVNKFDGVAMNPPFGTAGKLAMEHVAKAAKHLRQGGRLVALIPEGPAMEKRFEQWLYEGEGKDMHLRASYGLPTVTFERAGTSVKTRIVVLDKADLWEIRKEGEYSWTAYDSFGTKRISRQGDEASVRSMAKNMHDFIGFHGEVDLQARRPRELSAETIGELFDQLENLSPPGRIVRDVATEAVAEDKETERGGDSETQNPGISEAMASIKASNDEARKKLDSPLAAFMAGGRGALIPKASDSGFADALKEKVDLEATAKVASDALQAFPRGEMGMTPDAVKATPEWRAARTAYDSAAAKLKTFNQSFLKQWDKEYRQHIQEKRAGVPALPSSGSPYAVAETLHAKKGTMTYVAKMERRLSDTEYRSELSRAKAAGGYYSAFKGSGAIPGFQFPSAAVRDAFVAGYGAGQVLGSRAMRGRKAEQTGGKKGEKGVSFEDGKSRILRGLSQINSDQGTGLSLVSSESEKPETYTRAGGSIRPYTERADVADLFAEEERLIARAKAEGFFWDKSQMAQVVAAIGDKGGGTEHDVWFVNEDRDSRIVIRSTILDSYGLQGRSPAQYLKRLADYNTVYPGLQTRMIGVSLNKRGSGVIWTAQPFAEGAEFTDDKALQQEMESRGWVRIDKDYDENIIYRHSETGVVIRDVHGGNVLRRGKEIYPIDVIVTELGSYGERRGDLETGRLGEVKESRAAQSSPSSPLSPTGAYINPLLVEPAIDGGLSYTNLFGDSPNAQALLVKGFQQLDRADQRVILTQMARQLGQSEVLGPIIKAVPVDVMNMLLGKEWTPKDLLHDPTMLTHWLAVSGDVAVFQPVAALVDSLATIFKNAFAARGAKETRLAAPSGQTLGDRVPTSGAGESSGGHVIDTVIGDQPVRVNISPTPAQKEAGNYLKGDISISGHRIRIENPVGSSRSGVDANGKPWSVVMKDSYGYFSATNAKDGDAVDVFVKAGTPADYAGPVHVIRQVKPGTRQFDEYKVMLGYPTAEEARAAYLRNYAKGWQGLDKLTSHTQAEFQVIKDQVFTVPGPVREGDRVLAARAMRSEDGQAMYEAWNARQQERAQTRSQGIAERKVDSPDNVLYHYQSGQREFPVFMAEVLKRHMLTWPVLSKSPYGDSFYDITNKGWSDDPDGYLRVADHWNWESQGELHARTDVPVKAQHWTLARYNKPRGVYEVLASYPKNEKADQMDWYQRRAKTLAGKSLPKAVREKLARLKKGPVTTTARRWSEDIPAQLAVHSQDKTDPENWKDVYSLTELGRMIVQPDGSIGETEKAAQHFQAILKQEKAAEPFAELDGWNQGKAKSADAPTRAGDVRMTDRATEATSDSTETSDTTQDKRNKNSTLSTRPMRSGSEMVADSLDAVGNVIAKTGNAMFVTLPVWTASTAANVGSAVVEKTGVQKPLAWLGSNRLDKWVYENWTNKWLWARARTGKDAVKAWLQKPGALNGVGKAIADNALPLWSVPREWLAMMHESQRKAAWGREKAMDLIRALSHSAKVSDLAYPKEFVENLAYRVQMFDAMEGKVPMASLPQPLQDLAQRLRGMLETTGRELVKQGLMNLDTFEELRDHGWMPRFTEDESGETAGSWLKAFKLGIKDLKQQRSTAWHIVDTTRKEPDGQYVTVNRTEGAKRNRWRFRDERQRDGFYEDFIRTEAVRFLQEGGKDVTNMLAALKIDDKRSLRDEIAGLTRAGIDLPGKMTEPMRNIVRRAVELQRVRYKKEKPFEPDKLIKDPVYAVARYVMAQTHNAATAELMKETAKVKSWVTEVDSAGFTPIPDNPRFGPLAGKWVRDDIATQVLDVVNVDGAAMKFYDSMLRKWKGGKLVLNPGSHIRDAVGNTAFAYLGGNSLWNPGNWPHYRDAIATLRDGGAKFAELIEMQVLGGDAYTTQVKTALRGLLPDQKTVENADAGALMRMVMGLGAGVRGTYEYLSTLRSLPDDFYKTAAYNKYRAQGMDPQAAAAEVRKWFPYYDRLGTSSYWKVSGRFLNPFGSFFRESIRIMTRAAMERPLALSATLLFPSAITRISLMMLALGDDDEEAVFRAMRGKLKFGVLDAPVFSMVLPMRTGEGQPQQLDLSSILFMADLIGTKVENKEGEHEITKVFRGLVTSSPFISPILAAAFNTDTFTGRKIIEDDMGMAEGAWEHVKNVAGDWLPPLTPFVGVHAATLSNAGRRTGSLDMRNKYQSWIRAIVGLDVRSAAPDLRKETAFFRQQNNLPVEGNTNTYTTPLKSRLAADIRGELIQDEPALDKIAEAMARLEAIGNPVKTPKQMTDLLDSLDPTKRIKKEFRSRLIASFSPEAKRVFDNRQVEFKKSQAKAPSVLAEIRRQQAKGNQ